jgi:predicted dehydrogenase
MMHGFAYRSYAELHRDTVLVACCDSDGLRVEQFKDPIGFRNCYTDIDSG